MKTLTMLALAALLFLQTTGMDTVIAPAECADTCSTDGPDGRCAPMCPECLCCPTLRSFVQTEPVLVAQPASTLTHTAEPSRYLPRTDPAEIFHIPRLALA